MVLWESLADLDDLSASTENILRLLATIHKSIHGHPLESSPEMKDLDLTELVPRLFPFLRHTLRSVRNAAIQTLRDLIFIETKAIEQELKAEPGSNEKSKIAPIIKTEAGHPEASERSIHSSPGIAGAPWANPILGQIIGALIENAMLEEVSACILKWFFEVESDEMVGTRYAMKQTSQVREPQIQQGPLQFKRAAS